jgi:predicted lipoprotein with Yx(FWY)xxD motif
MSNKFPRIVSRLPLVAGAMGVLLLAAACGGSSGAAAPGSGGATVPAKSSTAAVKIADTDAGKILVDAQGRTMYAFAADTKGHSACTGSCLTYWPPVPAGAKAPTAASGVTATFGVLDRSDGTAQLTVDGWPMYTYVGDTKPGATTGQGKNLSGGLWWVVSPSGKWITKAGGSTKSTTGRYGY